MTRLLVDTSVLVKWFHSPGESEVVEARALREAHLLGDLGAHILDLALYELGNVLTRVLSWPPTQVADQLDDLLVICGPPLVVSAGWLRGAADLAAGHRLTFYDAAWVAAAQALRIPLVSADLQLVKAGLAESPTAAARRLGLV